MTEEVLQGGVTFGAMPAAGGGFDGVQLWQGECVLDGSEGADYTPFLFYTIEAPLPGLRTLDPGGWINPSTHSYSGGVIGPGTVPAESSVIVPRDGIYRTSFTGHASDINYDFVDFSAHLCCNNEIVDGYIGWNFTLESGLYPDFDWTMSPDPLTAGPHLVAFSAGDILFWAGQTNMGFGVNMSGFTWLVEYVMPLPAEPS